MVSSSRAGTRPLVLSPAPGLALLFIKICWNEKKIFQSYLQCPYQIGCTCILPITGSSVLPEEAKPSSFLKLSPKALLVLVMSLGSYKTRLPLLLYMSARYMFETYGIFSLRLAFSRLKEFIS